jgi:hypothetical protein
LRKSLIAAAGSYGFANRQLLRESNKFSATINALAFGRRDTAVRVSVNTDNGAIAGTEHNSVLHLFSELRGRENFRWRLRGSDRGGALICQRPGSNVPSSTLRFFEIYATSRGSAVSDNKGNLFLVVESRLRYSGLLLLLQELHQLGFVWPNRRQRDTG